MTVRNCDRSTPPPLPHARERRRFAPCILAIHLAWPLLAFAFQAAADDVKAIASPNVAGCYLERVQVRADGPRQKLTTTYSYLEIKSGEGGSLEFETVVIGGNFNICGADGKLERLSSTRNHTVLRLLPSEQQLADEKSSEAAPCRLQIVVTPRQVMLYDTDRACREYFGCGSGVALDGQSFHRHRTKQTKGVRCPPF